MTADKQLIRELSDAHGRMIAVYADRGGVTIDLGLTDRNLERAITYTLIAVLTEAAQVARLQETRDDD